MRRERLAGKKALVTGGAGGLGQAIARALLDEGALVAVTDVRGDAAAAVAEELAATYGPGHAFGYEHDVREEAAWAQVVDAAADAMGGLSVLVNNAGIVATGTVESLPVAEWSRSQQVNVDSVFLGCRSALPRMVANAPGSIINVSSIAGLIASPNFAGYNASKAAVWMLTKSVALHCARQGWDIRANSVHPAFVRTPILDDLVGDKDRDHVLAKLTAQVPLGRLGEPEDVAHAVVYLASDESRFMTGAEMKLDGGISAM